MLIAMTNSPEKHGEYITHMLRIWLVRIKTKLVWLASLENTHAGERVWFSCLDELFNYLHQIQAKKLEIKQTIKRVEAAENRHDNANWKVAAFCITPNGN